MKQLKASMPDDLAARLETASKKSGRSLSAEICARVEASFARDALDKPTRDFLDGVALIPAEIEREAGVSWHAHAGALFAFRQAIASRLARLKAQLKPKDSETFGPRPHKTIPGPLTPHELGVAVEYHLWQTPNFTNSQLRTEMENTLREIEKLHQQEGKS
jgi:TraY domain